MKPDGKRDKDAERAHLIDLLDRFGASHPQPDATHLSGTLGRFTLKWESHTEFVTYTIFTEGVDDAPFSAEAFTVFPEDWQAKAPGQRITSALIRVEPGSTDTDVIERTLQWFVPESLAISQALDGALTIAAAFRIDSAGHMRLAVFTRKDVGPQRIDRVIQRLCEIETYKAMAMLGLHRAGQMSGELHRLDTKLTNLLADMAGSGSDPADVLEQLLEVSANVENLGAQSAYRFAAQAARRCFRRSRKPHRRYRPCSVAGRQHQSAHRPHRPPAPVEISRPEQPRGHTAQRPSEPEGSHIVR